MIGLEFVLRMTPHVRFGRGAIKYAADGVKELGGKRVLVVSDRGVQKVGITDRLVDILRGGGLDVFVFSDVVPEPPVYVGDDAASMAKEAVTLVLPVPPLPLMMTSSFMQHSQSCSSFVETYPRTLELIELLSHLWSTLLLSSYRLGYARVSVSP